MILSSTDPFQNYFRNTIRLSNGSVGPNLGLNFLQRLSVVRGILNVLNKLRKRDKMRGFATHFIDFFTTSFINSKYLTYW